MFERFTDSCRKVMALANQEAQRYKHEYIGTEHLLLGLASVREGLGIQVLQNLAIKVDKLRTEIGKLVKAGSERVHPGKLPQTPRAKKVVEWAIDEARAMNHGDIGTEHLLLGLLQVKDGVASQVLNACGLTYAMALQEVSRLLHIEPVPDRPDKDDIQVLEVTEEFTVCPQCGYDGGFHNIFYGLNSDTQAKWILMCPSCKEKFDIGLKYPQ